MGTTAEKLNYLNETKKAIKTAIADKGVEITDTDTFRSYVDKIGEISSGGSGGSSNTYGLENLVGKVDENGVLQAPTGADLTFTGVTGFVNNAMDSILRNSPTIKRVVFPDVVDINADYALRTAFGYSTVVSAEFPNLETISKGTDAFYNTFIQCASFENISFPKLRIVNAKRAFYDTFSNNKKLTSVEFPSLEELNGETCFSGVFKFCSSLTSAKFPKLRKIAYQGFSGVFSGCTNLQTVEFPALYSIEDYAASSAFNNCSSLQSISFPALRDIWSNCFSSDTFSGCTNLTEIHFRADVQTVVEGLNYYSSKWGATNATIYFDL